MIDQNTVVYISNVIPCDGRGGAIIAKRHIDRLVSDGWRVLLIVPEHQRRIGWTTDSRTELNKVIWVNRPPQSLFSRFLRRCGMISIVANIEARRILRASPILREASAVVTICWGSESLVASKLKRKLGIPIITFMHDHWVNISDRSNRLASEMACRASDHVFAVSNEMLRSLEISGITNISLLYPVSSPPLCAFVHWKTTFESPVIIHAGSLHDYHRQFLGLLASILDNNSGSLIVLGSQNEVVSTDLERTHTNVTLQAYYENNDDAISFIHQSATALVVMYPFGYNRSGLVPTGFPSRFVEYCQLGMPIIVCAPDGNPIREWAKSVGWEAQFDPFDEVGLNGCIERLRHEENWTRMAEQTRFAAEGLLNPENIHLHFMKTLRQLQSSSKNGKSR